MLAAALTLLDRLDGPVLEEFPEEAPAPGATAGSDGEALPEILACPVPRRDPGEPATGPHALLAAEIAFLRPWYALAVRERGGRTTVGVSGLEQEAAAALLGDWLAGGDAAGIASDRLKLAIDDLRAFCLEAGGAQPGGAGGGPRLERWFWWETAIGNALRETRPAAGESADPTLRLIAKVLLVATVRRGEQPPG